MTCRLVSIIGPPAVGKTTLARYLARALPAGLIREDYTGNPFLADSFKGVRKARLAAQVYFLLMRAGQLDARRLSKGLFVSDYGFCQDRIFARCRLAGGELDIYDRLAERIAPMVCNPDVIIHLDASETTLLDRIARRGRTFEKSFNRRFLAGIRREHSCAVESAACRVISVNCDRQNLLDPKVRRQLAGSVGVLLGPPFRPAR